ncbi:6-carboxytetrahydropterin synthase QueD [bacterium]|nr:6-carboxytetrahydropterin synthase QueD [bacterium]
MFEVFVKTHFSAAHRLQDYPGNCARWHGHNWEVTVTLQTAELNSVGLSVDFREIKTGLNELLAEIDHSDLNSHPEFTATNPTSETVARFLFRRLREQFETGSVRLARVTVSETPGTGATYFE